MITIKDNQFIPEKVSIKEGDYIDYQSLDKVKHIIIMKGIFEASINPGWDYSHQFNKKGTFSYYCKIHPNMKDVIIVK